MSLEDRLDAIEHRRVKLADQELPADERPCHRPDLSVWASEDDGAGFVTLSIAAVWAEPLRFASLSPVEARLLARHLNAVADAVDNEVANDQEDAYERQQERLMEDGPGPSLIEQQRAAYNIKHGLRS